MNKQTPKAGETTPRGAPGGGARKPREWLVESPLMDFGDPALRAMARSISGTVKSDRDRALAAHAQVRAMRLAFPQQPRPATAGAVLRRREGDAVDKATLLVAVLRLCEIPARLLFVAPPVDALRGLPSDVCCWPRPMVEVWLEGEWLRTDTFIFDERYLRAAHHRLHQKHRDRGYGVSAAGAIHWDGTRSVSVLGAEHAEGVSEEADRFHDVAAFARTQGIAKRLAQLGRWALWSAQRKRLALSLRALRSRQPTGRHRSPYDTRMSMPSQA